MTKERPRKTVSVDYLCKLVNDRLALSDDALHPYVIHDGDTPAQAFRKGVASLIESVLLETGNYKGFLYLDLLRAHEQGDAVDGTRRAYYRSKP